MNRPPMGLRQFLREENVSSDRTQSPRIALTVQPWLLSLLAGLSLFFAWGARAENIVFPPDAGVVDVTQPPYQAKGDGRTDDTEAIQRALMDHPNQGAIIYLPNGTYLISQTLKWPHGSRGGMEEKNTILQGQSRDGAILKLADGAPGFDNPKQRRGLIWTGQKPAQRFRNAVRNLTFDTGSGNPGAVGMQFMANNQGGVFDVLIRSGDGTGPVGLDLAYSDEQGPCLIKNVEVIGFEVGIRTAFAVDSVTFEHITLRGQKEYGLRNDGQVVSIRGLKSYNSAPAVFNGGGPSLMTLLDCELAGRGTGTNPAVINQGALFARHITTPGYPKAIQNQGESVRSVEGPEVVEFVSTPPLSLFPSPARSLGLPIQETPQVPWDDLKDWASPTQYGAKPDDPRGDATRALQSAIDSGKTTVYLPRGGWRLSDTVVIRGKVRRLIGCEARIDLAPDYRLKTNPVFRVAEGSSPVVVIERLRGGYDNGPFARIEHASSRTLVLRNLTVGQGRYAYVNTGGGDLFIEDVVGGHWIFRHGQRVWARQFNVENQGTHVLNDGAVLWMLGYKTERGGTLIDTRNGGKTELLGGFAYATSGPKTEPMFSIHQSAASFILRETCFNGNPFQVMVSETRDGQTKILGKDEVPRRTGGGLLTLYTGF